MATQYANRMIQIERNEAMQAAIRRCKANHPKARRVAVNRAVVTNKKGKTYTVTLSQPCADRLLATCDCRAGLVGKLCYHIPAALACPFVMPNALLPSTMDARQLEREQAPLVKTMPKAKREYYFGIEI